MQHLKGREKSTYPLSESLTAELPPAPSDFQVVLCCRGPAAEKFLRYLSPMPQAELLHVLPWLELQFTETDPEELTWFVAATRAHTPDAERPPHDLRSVIDHWTSGDPWDWSEAYGIRLPGRALLTYQSAADEEQRRYQAEKKAVLANLSAQLLAPGRALASQLRAPERQLTSQLNSPRQKLMQQLLAPRNKTPQAE